MSDTDYPIIIDENPCAEIPLPALLPRPIWITTPRKGAIIDTFEKPPKPVKPVKLRPRCRACDCELSEAMDAYYGRDPRGKLHCEPCRRKQRIP